MHFEATATEGLLLPDHGKGISFAEVLEFTRGRVISGQGTHTFSRVVTDSRTVAPGDLFVALHGDRFDGHAFVADALEKGAAGALVETGVSEQILRQYNPVSIQVPDALEALGDLAAGWRRKFPIPVGVLTGSNGKTTTKDMTVAIMQCCYACLWSPGNFNNRIGLPLTLLDLGPEHERVVLEMGMNEPGEIRTLTRISGPQVGALLNIGPAHLGNFPSMEAVAQAKAEILEEMDRESVFVFNRDDPRVCRVAERWQGSKKSFGMETGCDVYLKDAEADGILQKIRMVIRGEELSTEIRLPGRHNLYNATAAAALANALGAPNEAVGQGLARFQGIKGRFSVLPRDRFTIVDDSYNANPFSMKAALETVSKLSGNAGRVLVLGDMLELGRFSREAHLELGRRVAEARPALVCITGGFSKWVEQGATRNGCPSRRIFLFEEPKEAAERILAELQGGEWILVKGSRGMALERVVQALEAHSTPSKDSRGSV